MPSPTPVKPLLKPAKPTMPSPSLPKPHGLFPTMGSLQEVHDLAESKLPITDKNTVTALLMTFQNTLLSALSKKN